MIRKRSSSSTSKAPVPFSSTETETVKIDNGDEELFNSSENEEYDDPKDRNWQPYVHAKRVPNEIYRSSGRLAMYESESESDDIDPKNFMNDRLPWEKETCELSQLRSCPYCYAIHFDIYDEEEEERRHEKNKHSKKRVCCDKIKQYEPHACCSGGQVFVPPWQKLPTEIYSLLFGNDTKCKKFKEMIVSYNTCFSVASIQRHKMPAAPFGLPVEKVMGLTRHFPSAALPKNPDAPLFGNFYLYEGDEAVNLRMKSFDHLDREIVRRIQKDLDQHYPWANVYKTMGEILNETKDSGNDDLVRLRIIDSRLVNPDLLEGDKRIYRAPIKYGDHVAIFFKETHEKEVFPPGLNIYPRRNNSIPRPIFYWDPRINSFCYPLLFPHGETGYRVNDLPLVKDSTMTYRERLAYFAATSPESAKHWEVEEVSAETLQKEYAQSMKRIEECDHNIDAEEDEEIQDFQDFYRHESESGNEKGSVTTVKIEERGGQLYASNCEEAEEAKTNGIRMDPDDDEERDYEEDGIDGDLLDALEEEDYPIETNEEYNDQETEIELNNPLEEQEKEEGETDFSAPEQPANFGEKREEPQKRVFTSLKQWGLYVHQQRGIVTDKNEKKVWIKNRFGSASKVGQIFLIDLCTRLYQQRHEQQKAHHMEFLTSTRKKFLDALNKRANRHGRTIGCVASVPYTIPGSPRHLQKLFEKTIAMSRTKQGKPDLFITATANVRWKEIEDNLEPGETWADRPFLVNEVFKKKFDKLLKIIIGKSSSEKHASYKAGIFGKVRWYSYSVEFQQRGPPHAHLIVSLKNHVKTANQIDKICQAYLPKITNKSTEKEKEIRELVESLMLHRPCKDDNKAYCRKNIPAHWEKCKKHFPKDFTNITRFGDKNYPEYRRPKDGEKAKTHDGQTVDNSYVVPYNKELLYYFKAHMNVEIVSNLRVVKYIFKYLFKGYDRVLVEAITKSDCPETSEMTIEGHLIYPRSLRIPEGAIMQRQNQAAKILAENNIKPIDANGNKVLVYDEFTMVEDQRALTACEAAWEFAGYPRHGESHVVQQLYVHGEEQEPLIYQQNEQEKMAEELLKNPEIKTRFKEWFALNQRDPRARKLTYPEIVKRYKFEKGQWTNKERERHDLFGAVKAVHPRNTEVFAIRLLTTVQKGPKSFEELRTVNGEIKPTFVAAAKALKLMNDNQEWHNAMKEAAEEKTSPLTLRRMYSSILVFNAVEDPVQLYLDFEKDLVDMRNDWNDEQKRAHALRHIDSFLRAHLKSLEDFKLHELYIPTDIPRDDGERWQIDDSGIGQVSVSEARTESKSLIPTLTKEQKDVFDKIINDIIEKKRDKCFFIQGSGGTGKTRLMKALYYDLIARNKNVVCVAHTGVAAKLLIYGSTAHRAFHIPLTVEDTMKCSVELETDEAAFLEKVNVVLWDEATMTDHRILQAVHRLFVKLHNESQGRLFGGVRFVFGGDWKQTLPIVAGCRGADVVNYTIKGSDLWKKTEVLQLKTNMRAQGDPKFAEWIDELGSGKNNIERKNKKLKKKTEERDQHVSLDYGTIVDTENELIEAIFGKLEGDFRTKIDQFKSSAILAVDNKTTFDINNKILRKSSHDITCFTSIDEHDPSRGFAHLDPEVYHGETPSGLPLHELNLVPGAPVILLRNINIKLGLVNGTRMVVDELGKNVIWMKVLDRNKHTPERWPLTRMKFVNANVLSREQAFIRTQFPVRLAFAMTCNKAQGQTLEKVGILLRTPCFAHGQLYVAVSRVCNSKSLFIYNFAGSDEKDEKKRKELKKITINVVYNYALNELLK